MRHILFATEIETEEFRTNGINISENEVDCLFNALTSEADTADLADEKACLEAFYRATLDY